LAHGKASAGKPRKVPGDLHSLEFIKCVVVVVVVVVVATACEGLTSLSGL